MNGKTVRNILFLGLLSVFPLHQARAVTPPPDYALFSQLNPSGLPAGVAYAPTDECIDVSGNLAVVSAGVFYSGQDKGRAYVYDVSNAASPVQLAELRPSDNQAGNEFGLSVAVSGNYVFVGAHGADQDRGAVYMYDVANPQNIIQRKITPSGAASHFGFSIAVSGNRLIAGAPRFGVNDASASAWVVEFSNPNSMTQTKLSVTAGSNGGNFAEQVDIDGNYAIVGHISESSQFPFNGAAHLYDLTNLNNIRQKKLLATDSDHSQFGDTVAISGNRALVSVTSDPGPNNLPGASDGALWEFDLTDFNSIPQIEFGRPLGQIPPFGRGLDMSGPVAAAGAFNDGNGAVYLYDIASLSNQIQLQRIAAPAGSSRFGRALAFDGRTLVAADEQGHAYLYQAVPEPTQLSLLLLSVSFFRKRRCR